MWTFITSFFTPTSLFLLLNIVIGTIALSSHLGARKKSTPDHSHIAGAPSLLERVRSVNFASYKFKQPEPETQHYCPPETYLARAPSLLDRVRSVNFSLYKFDQPESENRTDPVPLPRAPSLLERMKSINFNFNKVCQPDSASEDPNPHDHHVARIMSDLKPSDGEVHAKLPEKMKKSASEKSPFGHFEEEKVENRRPATARVERTVSYGGDDAVDKKADDFINRFKNQLKLQRVVSNLRYKEMIGRSAGN